MAALSFALTVAKPFISRYTFIGKVDFPVLRTKDNNYYMLLWCRAYESIIYLDVPCSASGYSSYFDQAGYRHPLSTINVPTF